MIEFKRTVYEHALNELVRFIDLDRRSKSLRVGVLAPVADSLTSNEGESDGFSA